MFAKRGFLNAPAGSAAQGSSAPSPSATPFAASSTSATTQHQGDKDAFHSLKPACVKVLNLSKQPASLELAKALHDLRLKLQGAISHRCAYPQTGPLSPSLINYIFYPLAELLRYSLTASSQPNPASGSSSKRSDPSDAAQEHLFGCLELLCNYWWHSWAEEPATKAWPIFEQLLLLGTLTLSRAASSWLPPPPGAKGKAASKKPSEETLGAICRFLLAILKPRSKLLTTTRAKEETPSSAQLSGEDWEWDGESELPSLETFDPEEKVVEKRNHTMKEEHSAMADLVKLQLPHQVYPTRNHRDSVMKDVKCKNALAQVIGMTGELACDTSAGLNLRASAVNLLRTVALTWMAGATVVEVGDDVIVRSMLSDELIGSDFSIYRHIVGKEKSRSMCADLAPVLPGLVSTLNRLLLGKPPSSAREQTSTGSEQARKGHLPGLIASATLDALRQILCISINDIALTDNLKDLAGNREGEVAPSGGGKVRLKGMRQTIANVQLVLDSLGLFTEHDSVAVQQSVAAMSCLLMHECYKSLSVKAQSITEDHAGLQNDEFHTPQVLIRWLLDLADTSRAHAVSSSAKHAISRLLRAHQAQIRSLTFTFQAELAAGLEQLTTKVRQQHDNAVSLLSRRIATIMDLAPLAASESRQYANELALLLCSRESISTWISRLISGFQLDLSQTIREEQTQDARHSLAKIAGLDERASKGFTAMLASIGACLAEMSLRLDLKQEAYSPEPLIMELLREVDRFYTLKSTDALARSLSALLIVERTLAGVEMVLNHERVAKLRSPQRKRAQKLVSKLSKEATLLVTQLFNAKDEEEEIADDTPINVAQAPPSDQSLQSLRDQLPTETPLRSHEKGMAQLSSNLAKASIEEYASESPLDLAFALAATIDSGTIKDVARTPPEQLGEMSRWFQILLNNVIGHLSAMHGPRFQGAMMHVLYPVVRGLAASDDDLRQSSLVAIARMSRALDHADVKEFIWENADYIMGQAVHALRSGIPRSTAEAESKSEMLASQAGPLVMVQVMRLLGSEAVVLLHDAVDELLDALDRFHGYAQYTSSLLSVLTGVVQVVISESATIPKEHSVKPRPRPTDSQQLELLRRLLKGSPNDAAGADPEPVGEPAKPDGATKEDEKEARLAQVVSEVMERAIPFLSHPSAYLRVQALQLLSQGSLALASRGNFERLMPVVNRAFPLVLARIGGRQSRLHVDDEDLAVQVQGLSLLQTWSRTTPDFLTRRFNDEAWPRIKTLLDSLLQSQAKATPIAEKGALIKAEHDERGRRRTLLLALISLLHGLVSGAAHRFSPTAIWELCSHPVLLTALPISVAEEVRSPVISLFRELSKQNSGAVWASLNVANGRLSEGICRPHDVVITEELPFLHVLSPN
ncbi:hypothetical protein K437DRAFT_272646 [Tilletiaria anomala UBC 951]|uniref:TTI1 C-terminal TPR domain-containing protein n=1 Tax=Tilletiaria anomala (strain ATCC 24038 / CBS 436.72 / UBC 951) TaxID=1037660 RepID=A0A066WE85_TILAU|nr:uncharacterized protein K437DRAFT_272646 [Tilletiaria anomala UBC 951]KDN52267.1 hypothetical protein K437DRAFT_272646 [Tilletiaria anomala UBC 951]